MLLVCEGAILNSKTPQHHSMQADLSKSRCIGGGGGGVSMLPGSPHVSVRQFLTLQLSKMSLETLEEIDFSKEIALTSGKRVSWHRDRAPLHAWW